MKKGIIIVEVFYSNRDDFREALQEIKIAAVEIAKGPVEVVVSTATFDKLEWLPPHFTG